MSEKHIGKVIQVIGPVLDIQFKDGELPELLNAIEIDNHGQKLVVEVAQLTGDNVARCIAMSSTDGLVRGTDAVDTGESIKVPVGDQCGGAIDGDLAILAKHGDYCTALGMGEAHIVDADGQRRRAACMGGLLSVLDGDVRLVATTWEWAEDIDQARAEASKKRAEEILARKNLNDREYELAQARLKRALVRTSVR